MLRDQLKLILSTLKFRRVIFHACSNRFMKCAQDLSLILRNLQDGLVLVGPPMGVVSTGINSPRPKDISEFFAIVSTLLSRSKRDPLKCLPLSVPIFEEIEFIHKREGILVKLAEFGISGAFILQKQDSLNGLHPKRKHLLLKEQMLQRYTEIREYLSEYLPHRHEDLATLMGKKEERQLSQRKAEAENWLKEAEKAKESGNYEHSIVCYKKAIELFPSDPKAYLHSGQIYVRLHKYPNALQRFRQAEEVAESLPEPNKEIGQIRVLQVRERISNGEAADSEEIAALMQEAVDNFGKALSKAEEVSASSKHGDKDKNVNAAMRIAGEIIKMDVASTLGQDHPAVQQLSGLARDTLMLLKGKNLKELPPKQLIFLGQSALDSGDFSAAEKHFYHAAEDKAFHHESLKEIIFLGHYVRRRKGPEAAIGIYQRLLEHNPSDRGAVYFNLAVAYSDANHPTEAARSIVRGIYIQPDVANDPQFYKSPSLHPPLRFVLDFYAQLAFFEQENARKVEIYAALLHERLLVAILKRNVSLAVQALLLAAQKMPELFKKEEFMADATLMAGLQWLLQGLRKSQKPVPPKLLRLIRTILTIHARTSPSDELLAFRSELGSIYKLLLEKNELDLAAALLATAAMNHPLAVDTTHFRASSMLRNFAQDVCTKLESVDESRLS